MTDGKILRTRRDLRKKAQDDKSLVILNEVKDLIVNFTKLNSEDSTIESVALPASLL
ncbi:MAG: hypothetical protein PHS75_00160 [Anaerolineaceae bacterium]|nr:hypothetical protein [Anaerolineaceae bacterium]